MSPDKTINIISSEEKVEITRENLHFFSKKLANGRKSIAIKNAKKSGAKTVFPNFTKNPKAKILTNTKASLSRKGSLISLMKQSNNKIFFKK